MAFHIYGVTLASGRTITVVAPSLADVGSLPLQQSDGTPDEIVAVSRVPAPVDYVLIPPPPTPTAPATELSDVAPTEGS